ncbi:hypothetical protein BRARA_K00859 [Brassica rapa]|uniref:Defensin-like protein n=2 Tax=Brassica TaxID=3705 RepID=A0A078GUJ9_BRANA|nr:defensin-like protein 182 [Brassica napus]RIA04861.1 hypothetical protein BRARA_K00859 [Brassica rapa]CAF2132171.1 unnamed protein product [Brassica napus]CDY30175.1 BnaA03g49950D [Brassica napus]
MQRTTSLVFLVNFLIIFTSVVNQSRAGTCVETEGPCENCDQKCLAKFGPSVNTQCGNSQCLCIYECPPSPPKVCNGGAGLCSQNCPEKCCDTNCATKFNGGHGSCVTLGNFNLCQCEYPC